VEEACKANQTDELKQALLLWGQCVWPESPPTSLGEIGRRSPDELAEKIMQLNNVLYSQKKETWDGESFWQIFKNNHALTDQKTKEQTGELEPLYRL
jgi:hypothetical protein